MTSRAAGDFPLVNVAVGFALDAGSIRQARLVLEGIASVSWCNPAAEALLEDLPPSPALAACAAIPALVRAWPLSHNTFMVEIQRDRVEPANMAVASLLREELYIMATKYFPRR